MPTTIRNPHGDGPKTNTTPPCDDNLWCAVALRAMSHPEPRHHLDAAQEGPPGGGHRRHPQLGVGRILRKDLRTA